MSGASSVEELERIIKNVGFENVEIITKPVSREYEELEAKNRLAAKGSINNEFLYYGIVDPMGRTTYLPDSPLQEDSINGKIRTVAAKDEFEPEFC